MDALAQLLLFRDVVDAGGFSRAAERRGVSHATVSKHVKSLEGTLGVRLLNRTSRTMSLTEEGRLALGYGRRLGASFEELQDRLDAFRGDVVGELRVSSLLHVGKHVVAPAVARFVAAHPRARVQLVLDDGPLHFSRDGFDLAVRVGLEVEGSLRAARLLENQVCIVAAPALLARFDRPALPEGLGELPAVAYRAGGVDISAWRYLEDGAVRSVEVAPVCWASNGNALLDLVLAGVGVGYVSRFAAREHLRSGALVHVLPELELPPFAPVYVVQAEREHPSPRLVAFKRYLADVAAELTA